MSLSNDIRHLLAAGRGKLYGTQRSVNGVKMMCRAETVDEPALQQRVKDYAKACNLDRPVRTYFATAEEISTLFAGVHPMTRKSTVYMWVGK